jgi:hypothetical protein
MVFDSVAWTVPNWLAMVTVCVGTLPEVTRRTLYRFKCVTGSLIGEPFFPAGAQNAFGWQRFGRKSAVWNWSLTVTMGGFCVRSFVV